LWRYQYPFNNFTCVTIHNQSHLIMNNILGRNVSRGRHMFNKLSLKNN